MRRNRVQWIAAVLAVALAAALAVLYVRHDRAERQRDAALSAVLEEAKPLELELQQLRRELTSRERAMQDTARTAHLMVGYQITERSDVAFARQQAEQFGFQPVFVLDATAQNWRDLLDALSDAPCEIVLSATPCTEAGVFADALRAALSALEGAALDSGMFLLRSSDESEENLARIAAAGYSGCIRHVDVGENTVLDPGLVTLSYSHINSGSFSIRERLNTAVSAGQALLFVFDMASLRVGTLTESDVERALEQISAVWTQQSLAPGTIAEAAAAVRGWAENDVLTRAAFDRFAAEQNEKIAALQAELDEIYARWDEGGN